MGRQPVIESVIQFSVTLIVLSLPEMIRCIFQLYTMYNSGWSSLIPPIKISFMQVFPCDDWNVGMLMRPYSMVSWNTSSTSSTVCIIPVTYIL